VKGMERLKEMKEQKDNHLKKQRYNCSEKVTRN
jgi:hypothetical protein